MEENVNEVLGIKEEAQVKPAQNDVTHEASSNDGAEKTLNSIASIILVCGIIASIICLFTIVWVRDPQYVYTKHVMFNPSGFATTIMILMSSLISWSFMRVLANISLTLKDIKKKMK